MRKAKQKINYYR